MISFWRPIRAAILLLALSVLLSACETPVNPTRLDNPDALPEVYGVVTVQVVSNSLRLTPNLRAWNAVFVINVADESTRVLQPSGTGMLRSRVFVGALPPGEYALFGMMARQVVGDAVYSLQVPLPRSMGTFVIEENRISSLGTLVFQPTGKLDGFVKGETNPYIVTRFDDLDDFSSFVFDAYPDMEGQLNADSVLGWEFDIHQPYRDELIDFIKQVPMGLNYHWLGDGRVAMTGVLGQIVVRDPETRAWTRVDTRFNEQLGALVRTGDQYIAAGERGLVVRADSLMGPWRQMASLGSQEAVYWLHSEPNGSVYALARQAQWVRLYSLSDDHAEWSVVMEIDTSPRSLIATFYKSVIPVASADSTIVLFFDDERIVLDLASGERSSESMAMPQIIEKQPDGTLLAADFLSLNGGRPRYSYDMGKSWTSLFRHRDDEQWNFATMPIVLDQRETLYVSQRIYRDEIRRIRIEKVPRTRIFQQGKIGVASWGGQMDPECVRLVPELSTPELIFASCYDGRLMSSEDRGKTWRLDYIPGLDQQVADDLRSRQLI